MGTGIGAGGGSATVLFTGTPGSDGASGGVDFPQDAASKAVMSNKTTALTRRKCKLIHPSTRKGFATRVEALVCTWGELASKIGEADRRVQV
jgi:hypothetical protein